MEKKGFTTTPVAMQVVRWQLHTAHNNAERGRPALTSILASSTVTGMTEPPTRKGVSVHSWTARMQSAFFSNDTKPYLPHAQQSCN
jgi:hypothetical protein